MTRHSHYRKDSSLRRVVAAGLLVLFVAVWGGVPVVDAATGHPGVGHDHLASEHDAACGQVGGADLSCALCDLIGTAAVVATGAPLPTVAALVALAAPAVASDVVLVPTHRADAPRAPPIR